MWSVGRKKIETQHPIPTLNPVVGLPISAYSHHPKPKETPSYSDLPEYTAHSFGVGTSSFSLDFQTTRAKANY
jgi:hypothetical protein